MCGEGVMTVWRLVVTVMIMMMMMVMSPVSAEACKQKQNITKDDNYPLQFTKIRNNGEDLLEAEFDHEAPLNIKYWQMQLNILSANTKSSDILFKQELESEGVKNHLHVSCSGKQHKSNTFPRMIQRRKIKIQVGQTWIKVTEIADGKHTRNITRKDCNYNSSFPNLTLTAMCPTNYDVCGVVSQFCNGDASPLTDFFTSWSKILWVVLVVVIAVEMVVLIGMCSRMLRMRTKALQTESEMGQGYDNEGLERNEHEPPHQVINNGRKKKKSDAGMNEQKKTEKKAKKEEKKKKAERKIEKKADNSKMKPVTRHYSINSLYESFDDVV